MEPITRSEQYLAAILGEDIVLPVPQSRIEHYLNLIALNGISPSSAGLISYDPDASYPDGSIGAGVQDQAADLNELKSAINNSITPYVSSTMTAPAALSVGDYVLADNTLYRVIVPIANGATLTPNTNVVATTEADELHALDSKKANKNGNYEEMSVGSAEQLISTVGVEDKAPYLFRTSGGSADIGNRETDMLVGGTLAWNQLLEQTTAANTHGLYLSNITGTITDGVLSGSTNNTSSRFGLRNQSFIKGHRYLFSFEARATDGAGEMGYHNFSSWNFNALELTNNFQTLAWIATPSEDFTMANSDYPFSINAHESGVSVAYEARYFMLVDLTQMFGSTIANHIASLETATPGAGVAWFRKQFPKPYYAYDAGELMSVKTSAHKTVGFNAWDEEWELGTYGANSGSKVAANDKIRSKNYIPIVPGTTYYFKFPGNWRVFFYTADKVLAVPGATKLPNITIQTPANARFMTFAVDGTTTYGNDICINLSHSGYRNGEYEPYISHTYALDPDLELRGIPKLDANNELYYDGDTYESDGTVTRKYGIRAYTSGDESDSTVVTDGTNTVYPLTTATTETAASYQNPQIVDDFGTEEYVDTRDVPIPVGHTTKYMANLRDKLQHLPDLADTDGDYVVRQTTGQMALVPFPIPAAPETDGTYVLKVAIADGTATYSWVAET